jgi:hypothetical protein
VIQQVSFLFKFSTNYAIGRGRSPLLWDRAKTGIRISVLRRWTKESARFFKQGSRFCKSVCQKRERERHKIRFSGFSDPRESYPADSF